MMEESSWLERILQNSCVDIVRNLDISNQRVDQTQKAIHLTRGKEADKGELSQIQRLYVCH
jgi:hypothetical protein